LLDFQSFANGIPEAEACAKSIAAIVWEAKLQSWTRVSIWRNPNSAFPQ
jgi:hypothetical protein